jgi:hypothetical protein
VVTEIKAISILTSDRSSGNEAWPVIIEGIDWTRVFERLESFL